MPIHIRTLRAAGLTPEQIVAVLEKEEDDRAASKEARRISNRDRMRAFRANRAAHSVHNDAQTEIVEQNQQPVRSVQRTERTNGHESALSYLLPTEIQSSQKEEKKERAKRDRGHVCPDDFLPSEVHFEAGLRQGIERRRVVACCEAMKAWSKSNANRAVARKVDWSAALFGWISRESERLGKLNGKRTIMEACDDLIDRVRAFDEPAPGELRDGAGQIAVGLLPKG